MKENRFGIKKYDYDGITLKGSDIAFKNCIFEYNYGGFVLITIRRFINHRLFGIMIEKNRLKNPKYDIN